MLFAKNPLLVFQEQGLRLRNSLIPLVALSKFRHHPQPRDLGRNDRVFEARQSVRHELIGHSFEECR